MNTKQAVGDGGGYGSNSIKIELKLRFAVFSSRGGGAKRGLRITTRLGDNTLSSSSKAKATNDNNQIKHKERLGARPTSPQMFQSRKSMR